MSENIKSVSVNSQNIILQYIDAKHRRREIEKRLDSLIIDELAFAAHPEDVIKQIEKDLDELADNIGYVDDILIDNTKII